MRIRTYFRTIFGLALAGVLFSGYITLSKLITETCPFKEPCPYFLGYPACWYGFGLFTLLFLFSLLAVAGVISFRRTKQLVGFISFVGILFAGWLVISEVARWVGAVSKPIYSLGLPTCAYGLIFYILIFVVTLMVKSGNEQAGAPSGQVS